ncbi:MAG: hypothetical protein HN855_09550 [Anaerolineae bacterium]|jgi:hypothetical protein|nr:hypothetical protein [Anaerolineae bacterium]MBT7325392.1 hypothetical protein [Anaerolineae bacterium]
MARLLAQIEERIKALNAERLDFFTRWLEDHTALADLADETHRQASLAAWFGELSAERAQQEYGLIIAEILWCADTPLPEFRRIASSEARRFLDE